MLPTAYVYPPKLRGLRDLLRRRLKFVRHRAQLYTHIHGLHTQANLPAVGPLAKSKPRRQSIPANFENPDVRLSARSDIEIIRFYDPVIHRMEQYILSRANDCRPTEMKILLSIPGVGAITSLTILLELDTIDRFPTPQDFASYGRTVYYMLRRGTVVTSPHGHTVTKLGSELEHSVMSRSGNQKP